MFPFIPITPPPPLHMELPAGHSTPTKRVHPRTSLQSPYSQRFERSVPTRTQCANETLSPASTIEHYAIKRTPSHRQRSCSLPDRDLVAWGYCQRRPASRASEDPAVAAIRRTYAEELNVVLETLIRRLEQLNIEDHAIWEDAVRSINLIFVHILRASRRLFVTASQHSPLSTPVWPHPPTRTIFNLTIRHMTARAATASTGLNRHLRRPLLPHSPYLTMATARVQRRHLPRQHHSCWLALVSGAILNPMRIKIVP